LEQNFLLGLLRKYEASECRIKANHTPGLAPSMFCFFLSLAFAAFVRLEYFPCFFLAISAILQAKKVRHSSP
jgi:hypothetical protein